MEKELRLQQLQVIEIAHIADPLLPSGALDLSLLADTMLASLPADRAQQAPLACDGPVMTM